MVRKRVSKHVFITGGTGSVGSALIEAFCTNGDKVEFQYNGDEKKANDLKNKYGATPIKMDFSKDFDIPDLHPDILINNAGINISTNITHEVSLQDWNLTIDVNLTAAFRIIKSCLPSMMQNKWGRIININSIYGLQGVENMLPYTVSKHALSGLTKTVAKEYAKDGITCNEICPGPIDSFMLRRIAHEECEILGETIDDYLAGVIHDIPIGRLAYPMDVVSLTKFLTSNEAEYLNGVSIQLDGGMIA